MLLPWPIERVALQGWLANLGLVLVAADELQHETVQRDREQTGLPEAAVREVMPIALHVTNPAFFYVRLHRRCAPIAVAACLGRCSLDCCPQRAMRCRHRLDTSCTHHSASCIPCSMRHHMSCIFSHTRPLHRFGTFERFLEADEIEGWAKRLEPISRKLNGPIYFFWGTDFEDAPVVNAGILQQRLAQTLAFDWKGEAKSARGSLAAAFHKAPSSHEPHGSSAAGARLLCLAMAE
jgi:hypothetical protein